MILTKVMEDVCITPYLEPLCVYSNKHTFFSYLLFYFDLKKEDTWSEKDIDASNYVIPAGL